MGYSLCSLTKITATLFNEDGMTSTISFLPMLHRSRESDFDHRRVYADYKKGEGSSQSTVKKAETLSVEDLLCNPGRKARPEHIVVIVRGLPGAGKTYVSKLLRVSERSFTPCLGTHLSMGMSRETLTKSKLFFSISVFS